MALDTLLKFMSMLDKEYGDKFEPELVTAAAPASALQQAQSPGAIVMVYLPFREDVAEFHKITHMYLSEENLSMSPEELFNCIKEAASRPLDVTRPTTQFKVQ